MAAKLSGRASAGQGSGGGRHWNGAGGYMVGDTGKELCAVANGTAMTISKVC